MGGAIAGLAIVGGLLYVGTAPVSVPVTILLLAIGAVGGGAAGYWHGRKIDIKRQTAAVDALLKADLKVTCNKDRVRLEARTNLGWIGVAIEKGDGKHPIKISRHFNISIFDNNMDSAPKEKSSFEDAIEVPASQNSAMAPVLSCDTIDGYNTVCGHLQANSCLDDKAMRMNDRAECFERLAKATRLRNCDYSNQVKAAYGAIVMSIQQGTSILPGGKAAGTAQ